MAWIESHQELGRHPKTRKLARALDISRPAVVGHLHYLWWWALDFAQDGDLSRYDADELAEAALWDGDPTAFVEALKAAGFIECATSHLHDWDEYAGKLIDQRRANARRQADFRNRHKPAADATPDVTYNADVTPGNCDVTVTSQLRNAATVQYLTVPNSTEEEREAAHAAAPITDDSSSEPAKPRKPSKPANPPTPDTEVAPRPRNEWWDALVEAFGYEPLTKAERSKWGKVVSDLKAAHVSGADIRRAKASYDARVASGVITWTLYPTSLNSHLGELLSAAPPPPTPSQPRARQPIGAAAAATMSRPILTADDAMPEGY